MDRALSRGGAWGGRPASRAPRPLKREVRRLCMNRTQPRDRSFDDLVRPHQQRPSDRQPKRLSRLAIDNEFELGRLLDGEVPGLGALENLIDVGGRPPKQIAE